jgi:hypothetical protein
MKIVSERQLAYIRNEYTELFSQRSVNYYFEGKDKSVFDNLILFTDDDIYNAIRNDHYLSMTNCQRLWNKYFWYLRYQSDVLKNGTSADNHQQPISKVLEELYQTCENMDDNSIESFVNFVANFSQQEYITFDYFHPAITGTGVSLRSDELTGIVNLLNIHNFNFDEIDNLILKNMDNPQAELLTFKNPADTNIYIKVDTFSAGEDQIYPIDILIRCKAKYQRQVDMLLVRWWTQFWIKMGPFVAISPGDKFETDIFYKDRKRIEK